MNKKRIKFLVKILISLVTLYLLFRMVDFVHLRTNIVLVPWWFYMLSVFLGLFRIWLLSVRWKLMNTDESGQISNWQYFRFSMIAKLYDKIMPGALGGDIVKGGYVFNHVKTKKGENIISMLVDRFVGFVSIFLIGGISFILISSRLSINTYSIIFGLVFFILAFLFLLYNNFFFLQIMRIKTQNKIGVFLKKIIQKVEECLIFYKQHKKKVFYALLITLPIHFITFFFYYLKVYLLSIDISFTHIIFVISLMWMISALPISVGGHGVREISLVYLFGLFGISTDQVITLVAVDYIQMIIFSAVSFLFIFDVKHKKNRNINIKTPTYEAT